MVAGYILAALVAIMWAPCLKQGLCARPGPVYARDRKNRVFRISPTGECCQNKCTM